MLSEEKQYEKFKLDGALEPRDSFPAVAPWHARPGRSKNGHSPHFAPASEMLERLRRRDAKYVSTKGALVIRARLAGVSKREKIAYAILLRGTLFSPKPEGILLDQ